MSGFCCPHCNNTTEIFSGEGVSKESDRLQVPILGKIGINPELAQSMDVGMPYVIANPDSDIAIKYKKICDQIENEIKK